MQLWMLSVTPLMLIKMSSTLLISGSVSTSNKNHVLSKSIRTPDHHTPAHVPYDECHSGFSPRFAVIISFTHLGRISTRFFFGNQLAFLFLPKDVHWDWGIPAYDGSGVHKLRDAREDFHSSPILVPQKNTPVPSQSHARKKKNSISVPSWRNNSSPIPFTCFLNSY